MENTEDEILTIEDGVLTKCKEDAVNVVIPEGVTEIGDLAFQECESLKSVEIPSSVKKIGWHSFYGCKSLEGVVIPDSVTELITGAFKDCTSLKSVLIGSGVTELGWSAFYGCTSLESVNIPEGVTKIWEQVFFQCTSLKSVKIPSTVKKIDDGAFHDCTSLESVVIPDGVECIDCAVFSGCTSLKSVVIGSGVTEIEENAFHDCTSLCEIEFRGTLSEWEKMKGRQHLLFDVPATSVKCSDGEWKKEPVLLENGRFLIACLDKNIENLIIPEGVTEITKDVFEKHKSLKSVVFPSTMRYIGESAFYKCESLESLVLPEGLLKIYDIAFKGCKSLKYIEIPSTLKKLYKGAFDDCGSVEKIVSRSTQFPFNEKTRKLYDATNKTKKPVLELHAAKEDAKVAKIQQIQKVSTTALFSQALNEKGIENCSVEIVDSAKTTNTILVCANENNVVFKVPVKTEKWLGELPKIVDALTDEEKSSSEIFDTLMSTTLQPLEVQKKLSEKLSLKPNKNGKVRFFSQEMLPKLRFSSSVKELEIVGVSWVRDVFWKEKARDEVETVIMSDSVASIGDFAFWCCKNLVSVSIPDSVWEIGNSAFSFCESLKSIKIPASVRTLGESAFRFCTALTEIEFDGTIEQWRRMEKRKDWHFKTPLKTVKCTDGEVSLTEKEVLKSKMKAIRRQLSANEGVNKVAQTQNSEASEALDSIIDTHKLKASFLRRGDSSYLRINAGKGGIEIYLSDSDLSKWSKTLPALLDFAETESDASALRKYALDNGFTDASQKYFSLINGLVIGNDNKNPAYLFIGDGAKTIEKNAFGMCKLLKTIVIASGLRKIENYAFSYCTELESIEIPETVTEIGNMAFFGCISLETILFGGTVAQWKALTEKKESLLVFSPVKSVKCSDGECKKPVHLVVKYTGKEEQGVSLGYDVTRIPEDFFTEQKSVEYVVVPEGITEIGARAFKNCDVQTVLLPLTLTKIDDSAFEGCTNLTFVRVQLGLKKIGERAFFGCKSLCAVWFYGSEKLWHTIEKGADWYEGTKIKNIECFGLDSLTIENGVVTECKKDAVVVRLPRNTAKISNGAFKDCVCLKYVAFYSSLTEIGNNAFQNCTALDTIVFDGKLSQWEEEVKKGTDWNKNVPAKVVHCKYGDSRI